MSHENMGIMLLIIWLRLPGTCEIRYFHTKLFCTSIIRPLLITFATKLYLRSETYTSYKFYALNHKNGILSVFFVWPCKKSCTCQICIFSYKFMEYDDSSRIKYRWSYLFKQVFHLKSHWKIKVAKCPKFDTHQVAQDSIVTTFPIYRLSGAFWWDNSGTIPFVSENQEKSLKHTFLTFF